MNLVENAVQSINRALDDYALHTSRTEHLEDVSDFFVNRLAEDSVTAKQGLRGLFRESPAWDETLDALVINGTRTHNPDYGFIRELAHRILHPAIMSYDSTTPSRDVIYHAINFFSEPDMSPEQQEKSITAIKLIAPKAYAPNKKMSRIFKAVCDALKCSDDSAGSDFQRMYAQFADELSSRKIGFKLYVSLNPAHFLTMSNPKGDNRGETLTSCHSFNSNEYEYVVGCAGYARDDVSFIVFTVADPKNLETLNNRKTSRQIFAYSPGNGLLLQSRLYNTQGGTRGAQEESKLYRDLIQREISMLENVPNLWKTYSFCNGKEFTVCTRSGFGGYADWEHSDFDGKISIRKDCEETFEPLRVGEYGLCIECGEITDSHLYCTDCGSEDNAYYCDECGERTSLETYTVHNGGREMQVCEYCREDHYNRCAHCDEYYHLDELTCPQGDYVCEDCEREHYTECHECNELHYDDDIHQFLDSQGFQCDVCIDCIDDHYTECSHCGTYFHKDACGLDIEGLCPNCQEAEEEVA